MAPVRSHRCIYEEELCLREVSAKGTLSLRGTGGSERDRAHRQLDTRGSQTGSLGRLCPVICLVWPVPGWLV